MKKSRFTLFLACILGFAAGTSSLFLFFGEEKATNAQTLPFFQKQKVEAAPHGKYAQNAQPVATLVQRPAPDRNMPIPEHPSTLPKPDESPLFVERYAEFIPEERISIQVYERCNKSVVNIDTRTTHNTMFFGEVDEPGAGSGVIWDREGHIVTNSHVISQVDSVTVTLFTGESYPATVVGEDPITDLAVLKIKAPPEVLFPVAFADSARLLVGQKVFAIGNPFGLERTLTSGLISSLNRSIPGRYQARSIKGAIQIDAAINPGNSGGALLDSQGRLIGINTAIASQSGGSHGVGFAIPSNTVSRIVPQLIRSGKVIRGEVGILRVRQVESHKGLMVIAIDPKGAAAKAGLKTPKTTKQKELFRGFVVERNAVDWAAADVIVGVDGVKTKKADDFTAVVDDHKPGDRLVLEVLRGGKIVQIPIVLE